MKYNMKPLRQIIAKQFGFYGNFAYHMGITEDHNADLLFGLVPWTQKEIEKAVDLLKISPVMVQPLFFTLA